MSTAKTLEAPQINVDDFTYPIEAVVAQERAATYPIPLKARSYVDLFMAWLKANPKAAHEIEAVALGIDARGLTVSTKYLIERQRYEGRTRLVAVPYIDQYGAEHNYCINNTVTPLLARWLLSMHPTLRIEKRKSMFDDLEKEIAECLRNQSR
ncbi:hypothetical protein [Olsenella sp. Marseille-P4559]|uniref:hypothetical protein n=1 Tax=Olsenella sp. Marseille-P4559 TaxID=2364795 RepID=UPI00102F375B|nr:hypothetical protein [Olsenella sp. Marseille-P4559]